MASARLTPEGTAAVASVAAVIAASPPTTMFQIRAHTDTTGPASANQWLSEARATTVCNELIRQGIPIERLSAAGLGETAPLVSPEVTAEDQARNRRVEVVRVV